MRFFLLACLLGLAVSLNNKQLIGLKKLLTKLKGGVFPTCNLILFSDQVDYEEADKRCTNFTMGTDKAQKGNLATVNDKEKNADLQQLLSWAYPIKAGDKSRWGPDKWVWAGLRKTKNNGYDGSFSTKYDPQDWSWADGSHPTDFKKWFNKQQPDQAALKFGKKGCNENPNCLQNQMRVNHAGKWDDTFKFMKHPYACDYQGKYIISATPKTWPMAKEACENAGLILAKVRSVEEVDEITSAAHYFLGPRDTSLRVFDPSNWLWLGGNDLNEEAKWEWVSDGEEIDVDATWMTWRIPNPDDAKRVGKRGQDVLSISKWGVFDDSYDTKRKRPFACQCPGT